MNELNFSRSSGRVVNEQGETVNVANEIVNISTAIQSINTESGEQLTELSQIAASSQITAEVLGIAEEDITRGLRSINTDHGAIHLGIGFCLHLYHDSLAQGAHKIYRFKGPSTLFAHIKSIQLSAEGATLLAKLVKGATITNLGTELTDCICNLNDNSLITPQSKVFDESVAYTGGITWCSAIAHGDTTGTGVDANRSRSSGEFIQSDYLEYVTKSNDTDYVIDIKNIDTKDNPALNISVDMFFYEENQGIITNGA